jgi:exodeoxyribonuclease VII large subunit
VSEQASLRFGERRPADRPKPPRPTVLTVAELARRIQGALEQGLGTVWVVGEISNLHPHRSGHCYFTLKDATAQISAVLFRSAFQRMRFRPEDGLEVLAGGRVRFYESQGKVQLYVDSLEPRGLGALRLALEQLRDKLATEGLLDAERKRALPFLPRCVGVVTALGGAALRDIVTVLYGRYPNLRVVVRPVRVQGAGAEREIAAGIRELAALEAVDVLIVGRGGGSIEDLWAFNDEVVARAIAASRVPVVSAVGHEIDVTIADLVADARAPTPSAAAALVVPCKADLAAAVEDRRRALVAALGRGIAVRRRAVRALAARVRDPRRAAELARARTRELEIRMRRAMRRLAIRAGESVLALDERLLVATPVRRIAFLHGRIDELELRLAASLRHRFELARERLRRSATTLSSLSPLAVLERGFAVVWKDGDAHPLRSANDADAGDRLRIRLAEGELAARVESRTADPKSIFRK